MRIDEITVDGFRNLKPQSIEFTSGLNVFIGPNGSGKTNLLETLFVLSLSRSQKGAADAVLIGETADYYRLEGSLALNDRQYRVAVACERAGRKKITLDGTTIKASELYDRFCAVSTGPEDSSILSGSPSNRRLFMDIYLSQLTRSYLGNLTDYQRALSQKNAALKNEMDPEPFDGLLVDYGSRLMAERKKFVDSLRPIAVECYATVANGEQMELTYQPKVELDPDSDELDQIKHAFTDKLNQVRVRERAAKVTLAGPHRDDLDFVINKRPARTHASQGQWRTAAVSLKYAVYDLLKKTKGTAPVLLLDEIFAELDNDRAVRMMRLFAEAEQTFVTTATDLPESTTTAALYHISDGQVTKG